MPKKKAIADCSKHITQMRAIKARLIEISLKVDNYIYKQKPLTEIQAKAFLDEISSYKIQCEDDIGYLQVIEKLTKYMNIIISNYANSNACINLNSKITNAISNTVQLTATTEIPSLDQNPILSDKFIHENPQHNIDKQKESQNDLESTLKSDSREECGKIKEIHKISDETNFKETIIDFDKCSTTNLSQNFFKIVKNCIDDSNKEAYSLQGTIPAKEAYKENKNENETAVIINKKIRNENEVRISNPLKNNYCFFICVDDESIQKNNNLSENVSGNEPDVNIAFNTFTLSSKKISKILINAQDIPNRPVNKSIKEKSSKQNVNKTRAINLSVNNNSKGDETNKNVIKFKTVDNDLKTQSQELMKTKSKNEKRKSKSISTCKLNDFGDTFTANKHKNSINATKNTKGDKTKTSTTKTKKKSNPEIRKSANKPKTTHECDTLQKETKTDLHEKAVNDLSWFESIKFVREIDEREYFKPLPGLDDDFWHNQILPYIDENEFII